MSEAVTTPDPALAPIAPREISFFVPGVPVPKGSKRAFARGGRAVMVENNADRLRPWMSSITLAARDAGAYADEGPVTVGLTFYFPRPKGHFNAKGELRPKAPRFPAGKPDLDKIVRSVLDALANVAFADDSRVVGLDPPPWKFYAGGPWAAPSIPASFSDASGLRVVVRRLS